MLAITAWNLNPNRLWFVRLADTGTGIRVELYLTQEDAEAQANLQASGATSAHGSDLPLALTADPGATVAISLFQATYPWHLRVTGAASDPTKIFRVKEFVDLDEISHSIYRNADLITTRARAEIDAHTHAVIKKELPLGSHLPTLEPGEIVRVTSSRRGRDELLQATEHRIMGEIGEDGETRLTSSITVAQYLPLRR